MTEQRDFEWDEAKAATNVKAHGVTFEFATRAWNDANALSIDTTRPDDGEDRAKIVADIEGKIYTVVFTVRGTVTRLISARRSNSKEEKAYGNP